jgi:hypothetical protein
LTHIELTWPLVQAPFHTGKTKRHVR